MERKDIILGRVLIEQGWISNEDLTRCLKQSAQRDQGRPDPGAPRSDLGAVLLERRLISELDLEALRVEISRTLARGTNPESDEREDEAIVGVLARSGRLSKAHLEEAQARRTALPATARAPRLTEILLEEGWITFSALLEALQERKRPDAHVTCRSCRTPAVIAQYDPGRMYLCKTCTGELVPTADLPPPPQPKPAAKPPEKDTGLRSVFGKYGSPLEIGRGGSGVVYKAWDEPHQRWVALKVVSEDGHLESLTRLRREVEVARALHHPNLVAIYDVTQVGSNHLLVMEYVDGETLAGKRMPPPVAARLIAELSHALQYAHSRGIVHRDIKPQNIMIDRAGKPHLMDFGLAKSLDRPSSITSVGIAMGTPSYMAPEQAIGRTSRVDRRTDIYSLGAVLYDLVTGRPPFRGTNPLDTLRRVMYEELTRPSQVVPDFPRKLEEILQKALDKDKNRRHQTAKHLADDLERFAGGS